jgi:cystathionine beta-lyase
MSPSKAFNTPGIISSYSIVQNDNLRATFNSYLTASELNQGNLFAYIVPVTAYSESGSDWLEQVCSYISDNIDFVDKYLTENMPIIKFIRPMASFLIFLDCRELNLSQPELENLFIEKAGLALNTGTMFGPEGKGFMRMNIATSRATIKEALDRIKAAIE